MLNHHTAAACSPTRAMILSGTDAHLGGLGVLIEHKANEAGRKRWAGKAGYEGFLNQDVATIPEILTDNGYFTVNSGKVSGSSPLDPGFRRVLFGKRDTRLSSESVASGSSTRSRTLGPRFPKGIQHDSRVLQPLRLGTSP